MLTSLIARRIAAAGVLLAGVSLAGCERFREDLLTANDPDIIKPETINSPEAADALRIGALARFRNINAGGESAWLLGGLLTDEWKSSDTFLQRNETDQRTVQDNNGNIQGMLRDVYRVRTNAREAINALVEYPPVQGQSKVAQMFFIIGFAEMTLAENFCNGIPLGDASTGIPEYGPPLSYSEVFQRALAHFDSALALASGTDTIAVSIRNAASVAKGRVLVNQGQFNAAVTAVASVATNFQWRSTFSLTGGNNQIWSLNTSAKRWTVGDSFDVGGIITNALPFASAADPRLPVSGSTLNSSQGAGFDTFTNFVFQRLWGRVEPTPVVSGLDARLIEAEAKLRANDLTGMLTILNALRASPQNLGQISSPVMPALPAPADAAAARQLYFREKAFWTFSRGQRLSDLRRLIRQYGLTQAQVFPTGQFFKGGQYGTDVNLPITTDELNNPDFHGCTDRNP
jgi:starch-binding outer membrane protein, SusD/RagB family